MSASLKIDMGEVTRLTRAGRLGDAMALLQGRPLPAATPDAASEPGAATLDMTAPEGRGGAWSLPGVPGVAPAPAREGSGSATVPAGARFETRRFVGPAGARDYKVYVPSGASATALPLVLMLHGCTQSPDDFAAGTRMNALAEEQRFIVVYPAQSRAANAQNCWNWFNVADQQRGGGEPSLIAGIARQVMADFSVDSSRVYVAGLSAGGAAAAIMGAAYPDLFAAVGIHSGLACGAARDMPSAFAAMTGTAPAPALLPGSGRVVPTIVFHGDRDRTVHPVNGDRVAAQATPENAGEGQVERGTSAGMDFTRTLRTDGAGRILLEHWVLHGAGHAWSGGSPNGSYTDPHGPDASREMLRFFALHALGQP